MEALARRLAGRVEPSRAEPMSQPEAHWRLSNERHATKFISRHLQSRARQAHARRRQTAPSWRATATCLHDGEQSRTGCWRARQPPRPTPTRLAVARRSAPFWAFALLENGQRELLERAAYLLLSQIAPTTGQLARKGGENCDFIRFRVLACGRSASEWPHFL